MAKTRTMTEGTPWKLIFNFSIPLMFGNVFQQLYTVVDTMIVGKALGVSALAALGAADWLSWMALGMIQGITQGFSILMAFEFGAGNHGKLRKVVGNSSVLSCFGAVILMIVTQLAARPVLGLLKTPESIIGPSLLYLRIMFLGIPAVMAYNLQAAVLRALGDGKTPLQAMIVASIVNIGLDLLFVMGFGWGIGGAAWATIIAQACSAVYCFVVVRKIEILSLQKSDFTVESGLAGRLMEMGLPMSFQSCIIAIGGMIVQSVVNRFGVLFIAGFTATNKLYGLLEVAATSYGYSMTTYVSQNLGGGSVKRIKQGVRSGLILGTITSAVIALAMILLGKPILSLFITATPEEAQTVLGIAYHYLVIMSVFLPILYLLYVVRSAIQGMGNTFLPLMSGIMELVMRTGAALLLPILMGQEGVLYAEVLAWIGADIVLIISYFVKIKGLEKQ